MKRILLAILIGLAPAAAAHAQNQKGVLRLIVVASEAEAVRLREQIRAGASFEDLARKYSVDPSSAQGGNIGSVSIDDLRPEFKLGLEGIRPGDVSAVIRLGNQFALLRIAPEAEDNADAESSYRRALETRWGRPSDPGATSILDLLDSFATVVTLTYFRDAQFDDAVRKYREAVGRASLSEDLYVAMTHLLLAAELPAEAEAIIQRAVRTFPDSRRVRFELADLYRNEGKMRAAADAFETASRMKAPPNMDPALDRRQRGFIYMRLGGLYMELVQFDVAEKSYQSAVDITPNSIEARLLLGNIYVMDNKTDEAIAEFTRAISMNPSSATAHFALADVYLRVGRFPESVAAAAKALEIDPNHRRARYVRAMALIRLGREDEAQKELQEYRKLETAAEAETTSLKEISVIKWEAGVKTIAGQHEQALETLRQGIASHPDNAVLYLNLGVAQSKSGRHQNAVETFQRMLELKFGGDFVVHKALAREYEILGSMERSRQHRVSYLETISEALEAALN